MASGELPGTYPLGMLSPEWQPTDMSSLPGREGAIAAAVPTSGVRQDGAGVTIGSPHAARSLRGSKWALSTVAAAAPVAENAPEVPVRALPSHESFTTEPAASIPVPAAKLAPIALVPSARNP